MIGYFQKESGFCLKRKRLFNSWIRQMIGRHGKKCGEISVIFCSDAVILDVNRRFLKHDYYTDIITFDYCEGDRISGDLYIGIDTVRSNASEYGESFDRELHRVMIHGILHLLGYDDHAEEDIVRMRSAENEALEILDRLSAESFPEKR